MTADRTRHSNPADDGIAAARQDNTGLVDESRACPHCGERDIDELVWDENGEQITCQTCGHVYGPLGDAEERIR